MCYEAVTFTDSKIIMATKKTILFTSMRILASVIIIGLFILEGYSIIIQKEGENTLPPLFGNFPKNTSFLESQLEKDGFIFAVVGDTHSSGTFEQIIKEWSYEKLDFAVMLGDCVRHGTDEEHAYFRAECANEFILPFPIFYIVGNHDISPKKFPVSRFEEVYGPTIFSFRYQQCLFIGLQVLDDPATNEESLAFLEKLDKTELQKYRYRFVFMHIPLSIYGDNRMRTFIGQEKFAKLFEELGINYVFAGDYHGYMRVEKGNIKYLVTGGGGATLYQPIGKQFHHCIFIRVNREGVAETMIPVEYTVDLEDMFERAAFIHIYPALKRNIAVSIAFNLIILVILILLLKRLILPHRKKPE